MEKLKVGILGLGRGKTHLRNFLAVDQALVIGACDRIGQRREQGLELIAQARSKAPVVAEFDDLLALKPDAIVVASNGKLQVDHAVQALQTGCHVLSEVPGAYTEEECLRLRAAVHASGCTYMLAENTCFWDFLRYWRKWVVEGRFGALSLGEAEYLHYLPATLASADGERFTPSQARDQGRDDARPIWRADQPPIQYLTHDLGPLLEVLDDRVVSATCHSGPFRNPEAPLRSDGQIALFQTQKGHLLKIMVTLSTRRPEEHRYRLFGTEGSVEWFSYEGFCRRFDRYRGQGTGWEVLPMGFAARHDDTSTGHGGADLKVARNFTAGILEGRPPAIDVYRAIEYALPGILAARSADLGGAPVAVPDLRPAPFAGTPFWDSVPLPENDPPGADYVKQS
ncbi:MAG: hypothetical protein GKR89_06665 [Candidatus Latescibacteria bacterium]|nr:hypothetical protein [Candidatus Latescibacterota bacterium]